MSRLKLLVFASFALAAILGGSSASAQTVVDYGSTILPNPLDFSSGPDVHLVVARGSLNTPTLYAVVVFDNQTNNSITIENAKGCAGSQPDFRNSDISVRTFVPSIRTRSFGTGPGTTYEYNDIDYGLALVSTLPNGTSTSNAITSSSLTCASGNKDLTYSINYIPTHLLTNRYQGKYVAVIEVNLLPSSSPPVNGFKIRLNSPGLIGYAEIDGVINLQDRIGDADILNESDFVFPFYAPCELYNVNNAADRVVWADADYPGNGRNTETQLTEFARTAPFTRQYPTSPVRGNDLGGDGTTLYDIDYRVNSGSMYRWDWNNVSRVNGVQFKVPFESIGTRPDDCGEDPVPVEALPPTCPDASIQVFRGGIFNLDKFITSQQDGTVIEGVRLTNTNNASANDVVIGSPISINNTQTANIGRSGLTISSSGNVVYTWTVNWSPPSGYSGGDTDVTCRTQVSVFNEPTCRIPAPFEFEVGVPFTVRAIIDNPNSVGIVLASANYTFATFGSGAAQGLALPLTIPASGTQNLTTPEFTWPSPGQVNLRWTVVVNIGATTRTINCRANDAATESGIPIPDQDQPIIYGVQHPYFKVFGSSVKTGAYFGDGSGSDACTDGSTIVTANAGNGTIKAHYLGNSATPSSMRGSSVQYALMAFGNVIGAYSASSRTSVIPGAGKSLTFANTTTGDGGNYGLRSCISNFWRSSTSAVETPGNSFNLTVDSYGSYAFSASSADLNITSSDNTNKRVSIYKSNGDIYITSNILNGDGSWGSVDQMGNIQIVANGQNIYIDPAVTQIDATLVAIPDASGARGKIFTCRVANTAVAKGLYPGSAQCANQLRINGALVAQEVRLGRTNGSIGTAPASETAYSGGAVTASPAEIIMYGPENIFVQPAQPPIATDLYTSNSILSKPPVL